MLDRQKLIQAFQKIVPQLIVTKEQQLTVAINLLLKLFDLAKLEDLLQPLFDKPSKWAIPRLLEPFNIYTINQRIPKTYCSVAVDGSQIYPDKHEGFNYGMINIGTVKIEYNQKSKVNFTTYPTIVTHPVVGESLTPDLINCQRTQYEFVAGLEEVENLRELELDKFKNILLFDGSLIFWHLQSKDDQLKNYFLEKYLSVFESLYFKQALYASYISLPQSKDIINILRLVQEELNVNLDIAINDIVDGDVLYPFLSYGKRTSIFMIDSALAKSYPKHNCPCFIYLNVGAEIVRLEFPFWLAKDSLTIDKVCSLILDQCSKGLGYPVVLSLAHEQAVIKANDREFFYQALNKLYFSNSKKYLNTFGYSSAKLAKKRKSII